MAAKIILAVAGSGKTYALSRLVSRDKKTLIIAFTHQNIRNILDELAKSWKERFGCPVPDTVQVMTFDAFVYRYFVSPYVQTIAHHFNVSNEIFGDVTMADPPTVPRSFMGKKFFVSKYTQSELAHYIDGSGRFYLATLGELVMQVGAKKDKLITKVAEALNNFWDMICVDEFQDFREHNYDLLKELMIRCKEMILVGDYYQHSVSAKGNTGRPYKIRSKDVSYEGFVSALNNKAIEIDTKSLSASRRCPKKVCAFIRNVMGIPITSDSNKDGCISVVNESTVDAVMADDTIVKLHFEGGRQKSYRANNWSYSKGDTYKNVCVVLTESTNSLVDGTLSPKVSTIVRNKLYVALTRVTDDLYIMTTEVYKKWKSRHIEALVS